MPGAVRILKMSFRLRAILLDTIPKLDGNISQNAKDRENLQRGMVFAIFQSRCNFVPECLY